MWETLLETERFGHRAGEEDQGAIALVLDLEKASERVSLRVVCAWATHFNLPRKTLHVLCGYFEQTITAVLLGSKWSCFFLRIVLQDALSDVMEVLLLSPSPPSFPKVEGFRGRHHSLHGEGKGSGTRSWQVWERRF